MINLQSKFLGMKTYKNRSGESGVRAYSYDSDSISVQFKDGSIYVYNRVRPGFAVVNRMIELAESGIGLNSFINTYVRKNYARKVRARSYF